MTDRQSIDQLSVTGSPNVCVVFGHMSEEAGVRSGTRPLCRTLGRLRLLLMNSGGCLLPAAFCISGYTVSRYQRND